MALSMIATNSVSLGDASVTFADVSRAEQEGFEVRKVLNRYRRATQVMG